MFKHTALIILFSFLLSCYTDDFGVSAQSGTQQIGGTIVDAKTNEPVIGATVIIKGTSIGATTDLNGKFSITVPNSTTPVIIVVSIVGYEPQEIKISKPDKPVTVKLKIKETQLNTVEVTGSRISEKQKEAPLTVESMDRIAIKECAQNSFYEALGTLKGVDLTSASLGFTIINTRGFNSTSPVRTLQLIDGVDNQSPGLNFSLGNFLGSSELDVLKVDLISGASSAYFGPNAFNGVINMTTRSPFVQPGLEVQSKVGERGLFENAIRWAQVIKNKNGEDKFAYKFNIFYMQAHDWEANNTEPTPQSLSDKKNAGGYDAVNIYGDEYNHWGDQSEAANAKFYPGAGIVYRTGYAEKDLVDYNTHNLKANAAFHYKIEKNTEAIFASSFGNGTTVYQGDNRYSLKDILFFQNRIEIRKPDKFFIRAYATNEDAGNSYDSYFTALKLQQSAKSDQSWFSGSASNSGLGSYLWYWNQHLSLSTVQQWPGFPQWNGHPADFTSWENSINPFLEQNYYDSLTKYAALARDYADNGTTGNGEQKRFIPGTARFDSAFHAVTTTLYSKGGSMFYDKSALYHIQGEYIFNTRIMDIVAGGSYRLYAPDSKGTIFQDTGGVIIRNREYGIYTGLEKRVLNNHLKLNAVGRLDKNENFDYLFSPAVSVVYSFNPKQIIRISFSSAIRNPTLADQYLYYRVSPLIALVGNIHGFDSLLTIESVQSYFSHPIPSELKYFNVAPIRPEQVKTVEVGYRATLWNNLYMDMAAYYSRYKDFIGYKIGAYMTFAGLPDVQHIYRVATNATDEVTTRGTAIGLNYYFKKYFMLYGNYAYNLLDRGGSTDPLIPAYNTPENKYNIGLSGRDIDTYFFNKIHIRNMGFSINYKWIQGFEYEGSPQFTGYVPTYDLLDAQVSKSVTWRPASLKLLTTFKLGASNLLNNQVFTVYGGPTIGRMAYFSILVEAGKQ